MDTPRRPRPGRHRLRNSLIAGGLVIVLAGGGGAVWAAERFVVEHVEISDVSAYEADNSTTAPTTSASPTESSGTVSGSTYTNGSTSVTVSQVVTGSGSDTLTYYVADVTLGAATHLRSAFAKDQFGENITE